MLEQFQLSGKVAVISGASKGIGKAIAYAFGKSGAKVVVSSRKLAAVEAVAEEFRADGIDAHAVAANMGELIQVEELVAETMAKYGGIDIVVNNAATNPVFGPVVETKEWAFDKIMNVNVKGPFELCKLAYPSMKERGGGVIINISSIGGVSAEEGLGIYSVSKAALISLTQVMAKEWGRLNIRSNVICPGLIKTKFSKALWGDDKMLKRFLRVLPLGRVGSPEEIAGLAVFLASDAGAYCTGGVFMADGGYTI